MSQPSANTFCTSCGKPLTHDGRFCGYCGAPQSSLTPSVPPQYSQPTYPTYSPPIPTRKSSHKGLVLGITSLVIIVLAAAIVGGAYASASSAVNSLTATCSSTSSSVNFLGLSLSILLGYTNPETVLGNFIVEYGINNPSSLTIGSTWTITIAWASLALTNTQTFALPAGTTQLVTFQFPVTITTAIQLLRAGLSGTNPSASLTRDDSALSFHFTHSSLSTNAASNSTSTSLPRC